MNKYLSLLKEFKKCGSWAIWDENGKIEEAIKNKKIKLKPHIIFMGLNASYDLREAYDWANYHFIENKKNSSWRKEHCRKLAEVLQEDEFRMFKCAYMTDIIKNIDFSKSSKVMKKIKSNPGILSRSKRIFEKELNLLFKISLTNKFKIICIGRDAFDILCRAWNIPIEKRIPNKMRSVMGIKKYNNSFDILEIYHYSNWSDKSNKDKKIKGYQKVQKRIRQNLREIIKNVR